MFSRKIKNNFATSFAAFFAILFILQIPTVEAGGFGKTDEIHEYEEATWHRVYFDMNGLNLKAFVPNSNGVVLSGSNVYFEGNVNEEFVYSIITTYYPGGTPPKTEKEFINLVAEANPTYLLNVVEAKKFGAKYVVDMIPRGNQETIFWRFVVTKDRLIQMGTDDIQGTRRTHFFESIKIQ